MKIAIFIAVLSLGIYFVKRSMQNTLKPSGKVQRVSLERVNEVTRRFNRTYFDPRKKELKLFTYEDIEIPVHPESDKKLLTEFSEKVAVFYKKLETSGSTKHRLSLDKNQEVIYPVKITGKMKAHKGKDHYLLESIDFVEKSGVKMPESADGK